MHTRITARQFCELQGKDHDTIRMRFAKLRKAKHPDFPDSWQIDGELSEAQVAALIEAGKRKGGAPAAIDTDYKGEVPDKGEIINTARPNEVAPILEPEKSFFQTLAAIEWRVQIFVILAFCLVVGHSGFIWWDLSKLWGMPGLIGGGFVFIFILSGMVLMSEKSERMSEVRENMLWAVALLEALAVVVHQATFYRNAGEAYIAGLGVGYTWALAAVICSCSIGATIFYQKVVSK